jgi:hypothetical protein
MTSQTFVFLVALIALLGACFIAIIFYIKALRSLNPALYKAVKTQNVPSSYKGAINSNPAINPIYLWMWKNWRHPDIWKYQTVRMWAYFFFGALGGLVSVFAVGLLAFLLK